MSTRVNLTLVLPSLLWPHQNSSLPELDLPGLNALRQYGQYSASPLMRSDLYQHFLWHGSWIDAAKQQLQLTADTIALIATPLNQNTGMHQVQCEYGPALALSMTEAQNFCRALTDWFANDNWQFRPVQPDLWLLQIPQPLDFSQTSVLDLHGVIDITSKPQGMDAAKILQQQTELQMFLYQHPLNQQRLARGLASINDVWLQPDVRGHKSLTAVLYSNSSWAKSALAVPTSWAELWQQPPANTEMIICLDDLNTIVDQGDGVSYAQMLTQWDRLWWQPLWHSVQARHIQQLTLVCDGDHSGYLTIQPSFFSWLRRKKPRFNGHSL